MPSFNDPNYHLESGIHTINGVNHSVSSRAGSFSKTWTNTPNYRAVKESRTKLLTNSFTTNVIDHRYASGSFSFYPTSTPNDPNTVSGVLWDTTTGQYCNFPVGHFGLGGYDSNVEDEAANSLLVKVKNSSVNLAQAFAERKQTADLLASSATRLVRSARALKKGNVALALQQLGYSSSRNQLRKLRIRKFKSASLTSQKYTSQAVANNWLEIQYGWKPLLGDVYGSAQFLADSLNRPQFKVVTVTARRQFADRRTVYYGFSDCLKVTQLFETMSTCKLTVSYGLSSSAPRILSEVGISNPYQLAWELVPFSFVADWFIPIGNYLSAIDATAGLSFISGTKSTAWKADNLFTGVGRQNNGANGNWTYSGYASGSYKQEILTRSALTGFPTSRPPSLKNPFSLTHVANAIALLRSVFR